MKTVSINDILAIVNGSEWGNKNDLLNSIIGLMNRLADFYSDSEKEEYRKYAKVLEERSRIGYKMLDTLGYYDDVKGVK